MGEGEGWDDGLALMLGQVLGQGLGLLPRELVAPDWLGILHTSHYTPMRIEPGDVSTSDEGVLLISLYISIYPSISL